MNDELNDAKCDGATYHLTRRTSAGETRPLDSGNDQTLQKVKASLCGRFSSLTFSIHADL
jgi:hypothetical protein